MKKISKTALVLMITFLFTGCSEINTYNAYENLYNCYSNMHAYKAEVAVTSYSNNSENKYTLMQYYKAPNKQRTEYVSEKGGSNITVINGENGKIISDYSTVPFILSSSDIEEKDYLMLSTFFDIYYASEETSVKVSAKKTGDDKNGKITLSAETGSDNPYKKTVELVVNTSTLDPIKMTVKDEKGKPSLCVEYLTFELNPQIEDSIFE